MILPLRRDALKEREALDEADELQLYASETPSERLALSIELSDMTRALAEAVGAPWLTEAANDLPEKARTFAKPLRALVRT